MATTTNLTGPQYRLMSQWYKTYSMIFTYVVEDRNDAAGTTTIRYSIFMSGKREDDINKYFSTGGTHYQPGDNVYYGPNNIYKPYKEEFPVITHWHTNLATGNTLYESSNTAGTWTRAEIETIFNGGDSAYCRFWLLEDVPLVIKDTDTYNLTFRFVNDSPYGYNTTETVSIGLNDFALITSAPSSFNDEDGPSVQYTNLRGSAVPRMDIAIVRADTGAYLVEPQYLPPELTFNTYRFNFTQTERDKMYAFLANSVRGAVRFELRSEYQGKTNISTADATLELIGYAPVLAPTVIDTNETTIALTGDNTKFIKYNSHAEFAVNATGRKGATVISYSSIHNGATYSGATGTVNNIEVANFTFGATDTRGITTKLPYSVNLIEYFQPTCTLTAGLPTNDDTIPVTVTGNFWNQNFGAVKNTLTLYYRWKSNTGDNYTIWEVLSGGAANEDDTYNTSVDIPVPNHVDRYTVQVKAVDKLSSVESRTVTVQSYPIFDWSDTDFNFNIPVNIQNDLFISGTVYPGGEAMMDYIVEQGTKTTGSGNSQANWVYRKWNSGIAECWCRKHVSTAVNTAWGNLFVSGALSYTNITWGVSFTDIPVANITIAPNASGAFLIAGGSTSLTKTNTGGYEIARGSALASAGNFYINYYAIGTWK